MLLCKCQLVVRWKNPQNGWGQANKNQIIVMGKPRRSKMMTMMMHWELKVKIWRYDDWMNHAHEGQPNSN